MCFKLFKLWIELVDSFDGCGDVDLFLFFERIDIARDVEIVVVLFDFIYTGNMSKFVDIFSCDKRIEDLICIFLGEAVLRLAGRSGVRRPFRVSGR